MSVHYPMCTVLVCNLTMLNCHWPPRFSPRSQNSSINIVNNMKITSYQGTTTICGTSGLWNWLFYFFLLIFSISQWDAKVTNFNHWNLNTGLTSSWSIPGPEACIDMLPTAIFIQVNCQLYLWLILTVLGMQQGIPFSRLKKGNHTYLPVNAHLN